VSFDPGQPGSKLWIDRLAQHHHDSYAGVPMAKFPEDLRVYEHLLWLSAPEVVIEVGAQYGGSALWFRDRLRALAGYRRIAGGRVITIDIDTGEARERIAAADPDWHEQITLIEGDVNDPRTAAQVEALIEPGTPCLLSEDSAHDRETTLAALRGLARFVHPGGFAVVEDGYVDVQELRPADAELPRGVLPALEGWLTEDEDGARFVQRRDLELYGMTSHPFGFLQRRGAPDERPAVMRPASEPANELSRLSAVVHDVRLKLEAWEDRALTAEQQRESWQERAVSAERQREQWEALAAEADARAARIASELHGVYGSRSWRFTRPLRGLARMLRR
jgi:cephalosporin hydroxylase